MLAQYLAIIDGFKLTTLAILILVDLLLGIIVAIKEGTFQFSKLANFLNTSVLVYVGGYLLVGLLAVVHNEFVNAVTGTWLVLDTTLLALIWGKLGKLGIPVPKIIA